MGRGPQPVSFEDQLADSDAEQGVTATSFDKKDLLPPEEFKAIVDGGLQKASTTMSGS